MAEIKPFCAIRPKGDLAEKVAALPYDVMSSKEAREEVYGNPYSFLHIDKAEIDLNEGINVYDQAVYLKAAENLKRFIREGVLLKEDQEAYYIYKLILGEQEQTGLVTLTSIDDYIDNIIKKHEFTRPEKERDRFKHIDVTNAHTGPVFQTYVHREGIRNIIEKFKKEHEPLYNFKADDGISHIVWIIKDRLIIDRLTHEFQRVDSFYIADGHHRAASAVKVGLKRREIYPDYTGKEGFNYFLSVLFPDDELKILDYNRVISDLNGFTEADLLHKISKDFDIIPQSGETPFRPEERHVFGMYLNNRWYKLVAKEDIIIENDPLKRLDVSILQDNILNPVFGIQDPRLDDRIDFVGGIRGLEELERRVREGEMEIAFSLYPTTVSELISIADAEMVMPPKSTWFEPKLRSGLFIHELN